MKKITKQIALLERVDQLIQLKATGNPKQLAKRLQVSEATVFRIIEAMKGLNAPVCYDFSKRSYVYTEPTKFRCGYYIEKLDSTSERNISGGNGFEILKGLLKF